MQFLDCLATLLDLPTPFTRGAPWFTQFMDASAFESSLETNGSDDLLAQVLSFTGAQDGWLDIWGLLFGIPRNPGEGNGPYAARISETVLAWVGTLPAVQVWLNLFAPGGTVAENTNGLGYVITLPVAMTSAQIAAFLASLNRIRPDGVPFAIMQGGGALYLGTIEYLGTGQVYGTYLSSGDASIADELGAVTLSATPLIPDLYFVDPILNPSIAPQSALP